MFKTTGIAGNHIGADMGRPSKLTESQWETIERRLTMGESVRSLAKEYGVSPSAVSVRVSKHSAEIKDVAHQIVATEARLKALPVSAQVSAQTLANELREISANLATAANYSSRTSAKMARVANAQAERMSDDEPDEGTAKTVMILTRVANDAASIGLDLIAANKDTMKQDGSARAMTLDEFYSAHGSDA